MKEEYKVCKDFFAIKGEASDVEKPGEMKPKEKIREKAFESFCKEIRHRIDNSNLLSSTTESPKFEGIMWHIAVEYMQIVLPMSSRERILLLRNYTKLSGNPGGNRLWKSLRRHFHCQQWQ